tara:strand:- start:35 stop:286 length:252 start_codon:yes stop_codon:yes gene_type:complete
MVSEKILYLLLLIIPTCKIIDVLLALICSVGEVSFEWDGAYYIVMGFINQNLFKENKLILLSLIVMLLMTAFSILIKYKFISY